MTGHGSRRSRARRRRRRCRWPWDRHPSPPGPPDVDCEVQQRGNDHPTDRRDDGEAGDPWIAELAAHDLALDLEADHEEEDRHQPVVDPELQRLGDRQVAGADGELASTTPRSTSRGRGCAQASAAMVARGGRRRRAPRRRRRRSPSGGDTGRAEGGWRGGSSGSDREATDRRPDFPAHQARSLRPARVRSRPCRIEHTFGRVAEWRSRHFPPIPGPSGSCSRARSASARAHLEDVSRRGAPVVLARDRVLPVPGPLGALVPGGALQRGTVTTVGGEPGAGATSLAFGLAAAATAAGEWAAAVDLPGTLGGLAAAECGRGALALRGRARRAERTAGPRSWPRCSTA